MGAHVRAPTGVGVLVVGAEIAVGEVRLDMTVRACVYIMGKNLVNYDVSDMCTVNQRPQQ